MVDDPPLPIFPLDIFQLLVDDFGFRLRSREERTKWQDLNFRTLLSLSLVTAHESEISGSKVHNPTLNLAKFIAEQPYIARSIQSIEVAYPVEWMYKNMHRSYDYRRHSPEEFELEARSLAPTLDEASLLAFLHLPHIHTLDIFRQSFGGYTHLYPTLSANLMGARTMLDHYLYKGTLSVLSLTHIDAIPIIFILSSPTLESLNLCHCDIYATEVIEASLFSKQHPPFTLRKLIVTSSFGLTLPIVAHCQQLEHLILCETTIKKSSLPLDDDQWPSPIVFQHLRHLETSSSSVDLSIVFTLAKNRDCLAFPSLESLRLLSPARILSSHGSRILENTCVLKSLFLDNTSESLDLYRCLEGYISSLEILDINWTTDYLNDPFITILCNALENISKGPNTLQILTIQQNVLLLRDTDDEDEEDEDDDSDELDGEDGEHSEERVPPAKEGWRRLSRILSRGRLPQPNHSLGPRTAPDDFVAFPDLKSVTLKVVASKVRNVGSTGTFFRRRITTTVGDQLNLWQDGELYTLQQCPEIKLRYQTIVKVRT